MEEKNVRYEAWDKELYYDIGTCQHLCSVCRHRLSELVCEDSNAFVERCGLLRCEAYPDGKPEDFAKDPEKVSVFAECAKFQEGLQIKTKVEGERIGRDENAIIFEEVDRDYRELGEDATFEEIIKQRIESAKKLKESHLK